MISTRHWSSNLFWLSRLIIKLRKWFQPATQTLSIFCSKQVLWAGFRFVLLAVWSIMHVISTRHTNAWHKKNTFLSIYIYIWKGYFSLYNGCCEPFLSGWSWRRECFLWRSEGFLVQLNFCQKFEQAR